MNSLGSTIEVEAKCDRCGTVFPSTGIRGPDGRLLFVARVCPPCSEAIRVEAERKQESEKLEQLERARQKREEQLLDLLHRTGANPWEHGRATLASFDAGETGRRPLEAVREFIAEARGARKYDQVRGLYLFGDTGCGKTHLAVAVVREFLLDLKISPHEIVFDHALSLITRIQDTYNTGESTEAILDRRINARVWVLDDLGSEKASDDVVRRLTMIFTERAGRPTLVTSNDSPERLEERHPEYFRLQSRLGTAYFRTVEVQGRDRRFDDPREAA